VLGEQEENATDSSGGERAELWTFPAAVRRDLSKVIFEYYCRYVTVATAWLCFVPPDSFIVCVAEVELSTHRFHAMRPNRSLYQEGEGCTNHFRHYAEVA